MKTNTGNIFYSDPEPARISASEWHTLFKEIPDAFIHQYRYYRHLSKTEWNTYLFPPSHFIIYGCRYLRKLKFDNSLALLRLWGFMLSESERLYRARQSGMKIIAAMGDLGAVPPLVNSFPDTVSFYPDCYWWTPFLNESTVLFDEAQRFGIGEECCFVRAALGAYAKLAYFPKPDGNIAATGASCDDMAAVIQHIERLGHAIHWFELPHRKTQYPWFTAEEFAITRSDSIAYQIYNKTFLIKEYNSLIHYVEQITGEKYAAGRLVKHIQKANTLRRLVNEIKELTFTAERAPIPALELMNIEFTALSGYSDVDECISILEHIRDTVKERVQNNQGVLGRDAVRVLWVTPPADPLLLNYLEDLGGRLAGTEFVINQALHPLPDANDPLESLVDGLLNASLIGTTKHRAEMIIRQAVRHRAEGVIISNIFASSHCAYETTLIKEFVQKELHIPVLAFDVVAPGKQKLQSQIFNRMAAFVELLHEKRGNRRKTAYRMIEKNGG